MNLALDFDDTYTRDPDAWDQFIELMQRQGHNVYCVTMRRPQETHALLQRLAQKVDGTFLTDRRAKQSFMFERGISIDVWIDDTPLWIIQDAK